VKRSNSFAIGIDLGGTHVKAVAVTKSGLVLSRLKCGTNSQSASKFDLCVQTVRQVIARLESIQGQSATCIGLAMPGMMARDSRSVVWCPGKLNGIEHFDWTNALNRKFSVPLLNDAHAALLGEYWLGAAKNFQHVILLTLGTGVGGAILENGKLLRGARGWAGLLGYTSLGPYGKKSLFNVPSPLEKWIGNRTVAVRSRGRFHDTRELLAAARANDLEAGAIWRKSIRALAVAIASFGLIFDPEAVIIGGGIARAGRFLFKPLLVELDEFEWRPGGQRMKILPAKLGEWAGAVGAARNALEPSTKRR
jgi:glucokinase